MPVKKSKRSKKFQQVGGTQLYRPCGKNPEMSYRGHLRTPSGYPKSDYPYKIQLIPSSPFMQINNSSFNSIKI